ncbi:hypothetical protein C8R43DRAFT_500782 [Mycena crocata]|nr:hypothetical protein C8R43DRAFT_500782 [Mycena crocata]
MNALPNELLDHLCSFLETRDLGTITRVSSRFRNLAIFRFLSRFGISQSDVEFGIISLSGSFSVILLVAQLHPIQRLVCLIGLGPKGEQAFKSLGRILSNAAPIPDIMIHNRQYTLQRIGREAIPVLSHLPQTLNNTVLIVKGHSMYLSRPRPAGKSRKLPLHRQFLRFTEDIGLPVVDDWMRIQVLSGQLTLVTLTAERSPVLTIQYIPGLSSGEYSSLMRSLDLGFDLTWLTVESQTNLDHRELMSFLQRHAHLEHVTFEPDSIQPLSLAALPIPPHSTSKITLLIAPAEYIPYLLPATPNAESIYIYRSALAPKRSLFAQRTTFDLTAYHRALDAIAALPGTHTLSLSLAFPFTAASLPWVDLPNPTVAPDAVLPEARLTRVNDVTLCMDGSVRFLPTTILALARWLALFPALQHVTIGIFPSSRRMPFGRKTNDMIPVPERVQLAQAIVTACAGISSTHDLAFSIIEDPY